MIRRFLVATLGLFAVLSTGCSSTADSNAPLMAAYDPAMMAVPTSPDPCGNHEAGCPCDKPFETIECGRVKRISGDYVWCSTGAQTCSEDGMWGKCTGDQLAGAPSASE
jgi:hypothetical protein